MGQPAIILPLAPPERGEAFRAFADAMPVGLEWLDGNGVILERNRLAEELFSSPAAPLIEAAVTSLLAEAKAKVACVQTSVEVSSSERVLISIAPDRGDDGWIVSFDRKRLERAKAEAGVLRAVIRAMASSGSKREAINRAIEVVRDQLPLSRIVCFELAGNDLRCEGSAGLRPEEREVVVPLGRKDCLMNVAWAQHRQVHVAELGRSTLKLPFESEDSSSVLVFPTGARTPRGLLCVVAPPASLSEGSIRIIQGLADAIGAVTDVSVIEASAARAMEVATQRDRLATIGQLVAGVAHEINNPLAFLKSNLHSLKSEIAELRESKVALPTSAGELEEIVSESIEGVSRIETIVQALKGTARRRDEKVRFDCSRAIQEAITIFRGAKKSECEIVAAIPLLPEVIGSPSAMGQVILNLMQNALDSMTGRDRKERKVEVRGCVEDKRLRITVRDHGTGIPVDVQKRMWDAFYTTKDVGKGTGLGLSICKEIVEEMGGWIEFETGPDGTAFHLLLPEAGD
ncbi:MAG: HAMP domain-containing sensor histidine kinase [Myxococcaceae bacterium]